MAKWGRCDYEQLKKLNKRLEQLMDSDIDKFIRKTAKELAGRLLNKTVKRTPVGVIPSYATDEAKSKYWSGYEGSNLRDNWFILPIEKHGDNYVITIANNAEYASYVEYGHRQKAGRYVPALGKKLTSSWVKGRYMLTISTQELERQAPKIIERKLYNFIKGCFDAE